MTSAQTMHERHTEADEPHAGSHDAGAAAYDRAQPWMKDLAVRICEGVFNNKARAAYDAVLEVIVEDAPSTLSPAPSGMVLVPEKALKWLFGEGSDQDGQWFGGHPLDWAPSGQFWWRSRFREMIAPIPSPPGE